MCLKCKHSARWVEWVQFKRDSAYLVDLATLIEGVKAKGNHWHWRVARPKPIEKE